MRGNGFNIKQDPARPLLQHWLELCRLLEAETSESHDADMGRWLL